ncbi:MAG: hypothetical protein NPIRA03_08990 [Nitrospirales bacterium]|nr:MAG: hypothetical protein NPIRA03_08990 [Nitrospirales bacterium]
MEFLDREGIEPQSIWEASVIKRKKLWTKGKGKPSASGIFAGIAETVQFQLMGLNGKAVFSRHFFL